ncbi:MAG: zinc-binding dehydrogenase, partial [Oscillospiraceae bacterium]|nr:zinc-binding dehydrogenase [Oscillospiraceae bacterium]
MKTKAVRLYGENDLRLEEFELPQIKSDEILMKVVADSICMSSYKAAIQGAKHKRVPNDVAENPVMIGHEFCGELVEVGEKWKNNFSAGQKVTIQPAIPNNGYDSPGYSYHYCGGDATYIILPAEVMENDCLLPYDGEGYFCGALSEPSSCVIGAYHANYHTTAGVYEHKMGIVEGGKLALLASVGPMGLAAVDYAIHADRKPSVMVVTDINQERLDRAASIFTVEEAAKNGIKLTYVNTGACEDPVKELMELSGGTGYDDVVVFAPVPALIEQADDILGHDGCLNFFSGPTTPDFKAKFNFYDV